MAKKKRMASSIRKHIRKEKARIRREVLNITEQKNAIDQLYQRFLEKPKDIDKKISNLKSPQRKAFGFLRGRQNSPKEFRFQRNPTGQAKPQLKTKN